MGCLLKYYSFKCFECHKTDFSPCSPGTRTRLRFRVNVSNNVRTIRIWIGFLSLYSREDFGVRFIVIIVIYSVSIRFTSVIRALNTNSSPRASISRIRTSHPPTRRFSTFFVVELDVFINQQMYRSTPKLAWREDLKN